LTFAAETAGGINTTGISSQKGGFGSENSKS
jgi:hypothetical protein